MKPAVLLIEDTPSLSALYRQYLATLDVRVIDVSTGTAALDILDRAMPQVALIDLRLPDIDGMEILRHIKANGMPVLPIVITAHGSVTTAVEAMREGAYDFLLKPFNADRLIVTVRNALARQKLDQRAATIEVASAGRFQNFIGASPAMQAVYRIIESASRSTATVFITGESGTGKELCADAIRAQSDRRAGPFVALNCGAIPHDLIESEVFGHVKGAFTGATAEREGAVSRADGGTLFLDEICEMDPALQVKLLRVVQTGTFQKVGGSRSETANVRYICATNRDPWAEVVAGRFREDLYYRLYVIPIALPPLRERDDDALLIARHFLVRFAKDEGKAFRDFDAQAADAIRGYGWPGNVRQLQNAVRNAVVLNDGAEITLPMLPLGMTGNGAGPARPRIPVPETTASDRQGQEEIKPLWRIEKDAIERAIELCGGNIPRAAAQLGISPSTIYRKRMSWVQEGADA